MTAIREPLAESERAILRETERQQLLSLDEDELIALHTRVRRGRDKHTKLYRRQASARVGEFGGRGAARPRNTRNAQKAELFEDALARVSRQLAVVARRSAAELKAERLGAARATRTSGPPPPSRKAAQTERAHASVAPLRSTPGSDRAEQPTPAGRKRRASTKAAGARAQARRDNR